MSIIFSAVCITLGIIVFIWILRDIITEILVACVICFLILDIADKHVPKEKVQIIYIRNDSIPNKEIWIRKLKEADNQDSIRFYKQKIMLEEFNSQQ